MIHLDTNFFIAGIRAGTPEELQINGWLETNEPFGISAIAWAELLSGPLSKSDEFLAKQMFPKIEPLTGQDAQFAAELFNQTGRRSRTLADCMIAAVAIRGGAKLATLNHKDFLPFLSHGLVIA